MNDHRGKNAMIMVREAMEEDPGLMVEVDASSRRASIGKALYNKRIERGLSRASVARQSGIKASTLARIEAGEMKNLTLATVDRLLDVLGLSLRVEFMEETVEETLVRLTGVDKAEMQASRNS